MWLNLKGKLINLDNVQIIEHRGSRLWIGDLGASVDNRAESDSIIARIEEGIINGSELVEIE